jgi:hypothetical protein
MIVKVELRDKSFNELETLDDQLMNVTWEYNRIGGCGSFSFDLPRKYCDEKFISGDFNIRIFVRNDTTKVYDLWYQGIVETKAPNVRADEMISIQGHGYQAQLSRIQLSNVTFASTEISVIVKNILDNYVVPNTDIIYTASDIQATTFTPDSIQFNCSAQEALQTLADITGSREWGVDENRSLFFKQRSSTAGFYFAIGDKLTAFTSDDSFKDIVNRVIVQGGDVAGVPFSPDPTSSPYNDVPSQTKYGRRDYIKQSSAILTDAVAQQFAASILLEKKDVVRRARAELTGYETQIESTTPIPLLEIVAKAAIYGEAGRYYGTFLYAGRIQYQVNRIVYKVESSDSVLTTNLELGQPRPNVSETISQLSYQLEQLRSASL